MQIGQVLALAVVAIVVGACAAGGGPGPTASPSAPARPVLTEADAVARVIAAEPRFTGITARDPDLIGQASWYEVMPASGVGAYLVTMRIGWGDCPAGCIDEHSWTYAVGPDGAVKLQSEGGSPVPPDAWPSSSNGTSVVSDSGIRITAVAGPICPVERIPPDPACAAKPVANATILIVDASGKETTVVTDASGQATAAVGPGTYTVSGQGAAGFMSGPDPQQVRVEDGTVAEVTLTYDTGIR